VKIFSEPKLVIVDSTIHVSIWSTTARLRSMGDQINHKSGPEPYGYVDLKS